ncbi:MAG: hypothetical protein RI883_2211 [Bacteroidota bacterium]|jgi:hypothetical protein
MKKSTKNKMLMYQMVSDIINDYPSAWSGIPKFTTTFATYSAKFESLKILAEKERAYIVGVKESRDTFREETAEKAIQISSAIVALATETKNIELLSLMRITKAQLLNRSHADTVILLDRILIHTQEYAVDLVEFGITQVLIDKLILSRDELVVKILSPRKAILKRKDTIVQITKLTNEIDLLLKNSIDKMVYVLRSEDEQFYNEYFNSRMLLSYGNNSGSTNTNG